MWPASTVNPYHPPILRPDWTYQDLKGPTSPDNRTDPYKLLDRQPSKPSVVIPIVPKKPVNKENPFLKVTPDQLPRPSFPKAPEPFKTPVLDAPLTTKAPVHPANTEDQWRAKRTQPRAPINRDVEMKDPSRPEASAVHRVRDHLGAPGATGCRDAGTVY